MVCPQRRRYGTILKVWFPGCPLFRGNFVLKSAIGKFRPCPLSGIKKRLHLKGCLSITIMIISIFNTDCVRCKEDVHFSEGPLLEVRLYIGWKMLVSTSPTRKLLAFWMPHIFRSCGAALFLAHSRGSLHVWTSHTRVTCKTFVIRQNSTIITFHCETKAYSESPDPSPTWDYGGSLGLCKSAYFKYGSILPSSIFRVTQFCLVQFSVYFNSAYINSIYYRTQQFCVMCARTLILFMVALVLREKSEVREKVN